MGAEQNLSTNLGKAQSIDFVEVFGKEIKNLIKALGITRKINMPSGSTIKTYTSTVTLDGTTVAPGDVIPLSKVEKTEGSPIQLEWDKKRKAVAAEDIQKYGFNQAIIDTDKKLIREIQKGIKKKFFAQLEKGTTEKTGSGLQGALAQGWGAVTEKFEDDEATVIAFINPMDLADYLGKTQVSIQSAFGLNYIENFLGTKVAIISALVPAKKAYVTAMQNICLAYADMRSGELSKAFPFTMDETGLIGVIHDTNNTRLTSETITAYGLVLFAERLDGIVKLTITAGA